MNNQAVNIRENERFIRLTLPPINHRELRLAAASQDISMAEFAKRAVLEALKRVQSK